jgi:hypothetical protein
VGAHSGRTRVLAAFAQGGALMMILLSEAPVRAADPNSRALTTNDSSFGFVLALPDRAGTMTGFRRAVEVEPEWSPRTSFSARPEPPARATWLSIKVLGRDVRLTRFSYHRSRAEVMLTTRF